MQNEEKLVEIDNWMFLTHPNSKSFKRCKKKLVKKNAWQKFTHREVKSKDEYPSFIFEYIKTQMKNSKWKSIENIGVLLDNCVIMADITTLVNVPQDYDILCLNADIKSYDWKSQSQNEKDNIYWHKTNVNDTVNFVINKKAIDKLFQISKSNVDWKNFIEYINKNLNIYTVSGSLLSEMEENYIYFSNEKYNSKSATEKEKQDMLLENEYEYINKLEQFPKNLLNTREYDKLKITNDDLLPGISLICPFTDKDKFFNIVYTFLKLDYPKDKLELVVVDTNKSDKYLKRMLPDDPRIKILNIGGKADENTQFILGYMLNLGVKYAKNNLICHFFDTNCYIWPSFRDIIKYYLLSNRDLMVSCDTGIYSKGSKKVGVPDIANMIYKKSFWKVLPFNSHESNNNRLVYKFVYNRLPCVSYLPFVILSFKIDSTIEYKNDVSKKLNFNLASLVPNNLVESFRELTITN